MIAGVMIAPGISPIRTSISPSVRSVQFFLDWLDERAARVPRKLMDPVNLGEVLKHHDEAKLFWRQVLKRANAA